MTAIPEGADVYLTVTELNSTHHAGVTSYIAQRHIKPDAYYLSNSRPHPLWLTTSLEAYAAKRSAIASAVAELNGTQA